MTSRSFEEIVARRGRRSGAHVAVAVHSTRLGPALGGARMWHYPCERLAIEDAMRLAGAMTLKAAAAGLDLGGGKGVIATPDERRPSGAERRALLLDFGDLVESLGGRYVTAEDVGTGAEDMDVIAERTSHVVGIDVSRGGSGDPSPLTALGVLAAIRACAQARWGTRELLGLRVTIIGLGHVGSALARALDAEGAELTLTDIDPRRVALAEAIGARWLEPADALVAETDVLAPCALGGLIDEQLAERLRCRIVCGAANNVLTADAVAESLRQLDVLYAPDFIVNSGGLISVYAELRGHGSVWVRERVLGIESQLSSVLETARTGSTNPLVAAEQLALGRLGAAPLSHAG